VYSMSRRSISKANLLTIFAGIVLAGLIIGLVALLLGLSENREKNPLPETTPLITIIPAPTETPLLQLPTSQLSPTPSLSVVLPPGTIGVGAYVKVTGTSGAGLRMRSNPGTDSDVLFLAFDEELFLVTDGPVESDNYIWWKLEAPYDSTRTGWSADAFLTAIDQTED
jgi:hypothetical protein